MKNDSSLNHSICRVVIRQRKIRFMVTNARSSPLGTVHSLARRRGKLPWRGQIFSDDFKRGAIIFLSNLKSGVQIF